ncbi:MAG: AtpZ/AtpI family protein [bacterium]
MEFIMVPDKDARAQKRKQYRELLGYSALGLEMGFAIGIGAISGYYLDEWIGWTKPWLTLLFMFFGIAAAGKAFWRVAKQLKEEIDRQEKEKEDDHRGP